MTGVDWYSRTEPFAREFRSVWCKDDQHAPACDGYYPPGRDTYRCLCACHEITILVGQGRALVDADKLHIVDPADMVPGGPWICGRCGQDIKQVPDCSGSSL
jgi:hypothetical protein